MADAPGSPAVVWSVPRPQTKGAGKLAPFILVWSLFHMPVLAVSNSDIKIANAALAALGVPEISTLLENSIAARTINALYADTLEAAIAAYPWRFARDRVKCARLDQPPPPPWLGLYQLPAQAVQLISVYEGDSLTTFDVFGRKIAVNVAESSKSEIWAEVSVTPSPDQWAPHFRAAFILALAAQIAMPITQDENLSGAIAQRAETAMLRARSRDAQGRTPSRLDTGAFIRARRGGRK
ncbi:hypothetical protein [Rhodobacter lacus]|uniref:Uncharacterized protein n=1 Tax=Rhodobacter lacus TaxID=1641972 RepID=A0ABW5ABR9_9RHOB